MEVYLWIDAWGNWRATRAKPGDDSAYVVVEWSEPVSATILDDRHQIISVED